MLIHAAEKDANEAKILRFSKGVERQCNQLSYGVNAKGMLLIDLLLMCNSLDSKAVPKSEIDRSTLGPVA